MTDSPVDTLQFSTVFGLQTIFTPEQLKHHWMTRTDVLIYGEQWRVRVKTFLPFLDSDDEELHNLKVDINHMPSDDKPLDNTERAALSALLALEAEKERVALSALGLDPGEAGLGCWNLFLSANANCAELPFVTGVHFLKNWVRRVVPLQTPSFPLGLTRLFDAIAPKPLLCQMYDLVMQNKEATKFVDIFDFNRKMAAMHEYLIQKGYDQMASLYGAVSVDKFPPGWNHKKTGHFMYIAGYTAYIAKKTKKNE